MKKIFAYDLEVYKNFFSAVFVNIEDENDIYEFSLHKDRNDIDALVQFVKQSDLRLVGYNSIEYDDIILKGLLNAKGEVTNLKLFNLSKQIIFKETKDYSSYLKELRYADCPFESVDLMTLVSINTARPSLKHCAIHLKYNLIQDLPLDPEKVIKQSDIELLLKYNLNDVKATRLLYLELLPDIELRENLGKQYNVDLLSASDSKIAKVVLDSAYGIPEIKETKRGVLNVKDLIPSKLVFNSKELNSFLTKLKRKKIHEDSKINEKVTIGNVICTMAQGGIHSEDAAGVFESDNEYVIIDSDVASYYPAIILNEMVIPEHLDKQRFYNLYKEIIEKRLEAKRNHDNVTAATLKITINSTFGLMGFPYYWLYDSKCMYQVTITGQLYLIDLAEKLVGAGFELISMNTDGVLFKVKRDKIDLHKSICQQWQDRTGFELEHDQYKKYVRRDVNNYIAIPYENSSKLKGIFVDGLLPNSKAKKRVFITSFNAPIIALSLQDYFKDGIKPETTINQETDIHNFFFSQRVGKQFDLVAQKIENRRSVNEILQKTNRWIVSKNGYRLVKRHKSNGRNYALMKDCNVVIGNDINDVSLPMIDRQYYIDETWKIIEEIEGKKGLSQKGLF